MLQGQQKSNLQQKECIAFFSNTDLCYPKMNSSGLHLSTNILEKYMLCTERWKHHFLRCEILDLYQLRKCYFSQLKGNVGKGFWVNMCTLSYVHHNYSLLNQVYQTSWMLNLGNYREFDHEEKPLSLTKRICIRRWQQRGGCCTFGPFT